MTETKTSRQDLVRLETRAGTPALAARWIGSADDDANHHQHIKNKHMSEDEYFFSVIGAYMSCGYDEVDKEEAADAITWLEAHGVKY